MQPTFFGDVSSAARATTGRGNSQGHTKDTPTLGIPTLIDNAPLVRTFKVNPIRYFVDDAMNVTFVEVSGREGQVIYMRTASQLRGGFIGHAKRRDPCAV